MSNRPRIAKYKARRAYTHRDYTHTEHTRPIISNICINYQTLCNVFVIVRNQHTIKYPFWLRICPIFTFLFFGGLSFVCSSSCSASSASVRLRGFLRSLFVVLVLFGWMWAGFRAVSLGLQFLKNAHFVRVVELLKKKFEKLIKKYCIMFLSLIIYH